MSSTSFFNSITSSTSSVVDSVDKKVTRGLHFLGNSYIHNTLLVVFILYAAYFAPKLNLPFLHVLDNYAVKFISVFLLTYLLSNSVKVSLVAALVIVVGALVLKKFNKQENYENKKEQEKREHEKREHGKNHSKKENFSLVTLTDGVKSRAEGVLTYGESVAGSVKSRAEGVLNYGGNKLHDLGSGMLNKAESLLNSEPVGAEVVSQKTGKGLDVNVAAAADHSGTLGKDLNTDAIKKLQQVVQEQSMASAESEQVLGESEQQLPVGVCMGRLQERGENPSGWNVDLDDGYYDSVKGYTRMREEREYSPF